MISNEEDMFPNIYEMLQNLEKFPKPKPDPHGRVIERRMEPYHDVIVYEDGYEEWQYIGE